MNQFQTSNSVCFVIGYWVNIKPVLILKFVDDCQPQSGESKPSSIHLQEKPVLSGVFSPGRAVKCERGCMCGKKSGFFPHSSGRTGESPLFPSATTPFTQL